MDNLWSEHALIHIMGFRKQKKIFFYAIKNDFVH